MNKEGNKINFRDYLAKRDKERIVPINTRRNPEEIRQVNERLNNFSLVSALRSGLIGAGLTAIAIATMVYASDELRSVFTGSRMPHGFNSQLIQSLIPPLSSNVGFVLFMLSGYRHSK